jgi:hypothetical protein
MVSHSSALVKVSIPALTEKEPKDRLVEFYRKLGWDGVSCLEPDLVRLTEEDWLNLLEAEFNHAKTVVTSLSEIDVCVGVGMMWANFGPSGDGQTPGMIELHSGWMRLWPGEPKLKEMR